MNNEEAKEIFSKVKELPCGWCYEGGDEFKKAINHAIKVFEERPQGEWIKITRKGTVPVEYVCSCCGRKIYDDYELSIPMSEFYPFCHCGADMRKRGVE